eukprot:TRINITY_DN43980_c0_g1_i1.p1 TRINITY_DN43980_c0_g1~~TRINITY_DN43980_c0_g1_i1.p1  ORF type:complete len:108 (-),score=14.57 TRINITY_DN43980_c0_g1_i1:169-492(-)
MQRGLVGSEMCIRDRYIGQELSFCQEKYDPNQVLNVSMISEWQSPKMPPHDFISQCLLRGQLRNHPSLALITILNLFNDSNIILDLKGDLQPKQFAKFRSISPCTLR